MIKKRKHDDLNKYDDHQIFLRALPKIIQRVDCFKVLYSPKEFRNELLHAIYRACDHIVLVTLYLDDDQGGKEIIDALLQVERLRPQIKIRILVDWHRARRGRIGGVSKKYTNIDWYVDIVKQYPYSDIAIHGIPININEALGVVHFKGFIIDDQVLYSGANLSNEYLHVHTKYRYDRYHVIRNQKLSDIMLNYIDKELLSSKVTNNLGYGDSLKKLSKSRNNIRLLRRNLRRACYCYQGNATFHELSITPLVGLGKNSDLNKTIYHLIYSAQNKVVLCTPYFNMPTVLIRALVFLLRRGIKIEIIVGDKIANDFYVPEHHPFTLISVLPYLYELNLRYFLKKLQKYVDNKQLLVRMWREGNNGYHVKGIWVDDEWQLITGNNLNPRSVRFDLENALLVHDPCKFLFHQQYKELNMIRMHTNHVMHYTSLQHISDYPTRVGQLLYRIHKVRFDRLINHIL
ncbi:CDP-diacylglycerol--serine O-phosphatidyltransferase [Blochmannia endosymbiont of Camponotus sp. C-046]|uniref:CDP-diacylglycerol--serine O-phosphatidyltransferase n=1 Tax=Blochmannia endosymbiont of Camponotus sp. C-046 TaxID=2945589 RepID=UPI002025A6B5|nr:CDP-diacylglycerol--serine O-phosphatidyltransferase [Blochmannia endosymbiont of Camponotus sp. C-046]URJ28764.1 CDP-diacylglycerol--serine O-phosphatidyltransferase [Blochmannia endosymbiont of Camponotus sp. C-046]